MSNHVHVVLHVDLEKAQGWSDKQVLALCIPCTKVRCSLKSSCEMRY
jgi:hypothetical protein